MNHSLILHPHAEIRQKVRIETFRINEQLSQFSCFNKNVSNPVLGTDDLELEESLRPSKMEIEKDDERKMRLKRKLSEFHCVHLYESLDRIGFSADQVSSIDNTILDKINVPLPERERIIETITKEQMRLEAGDTFEL